MSYVITTISILIFAFGAGAIFGAPWVPAFNQDIDELLDLARVKKGTHFIDLGCGDGKILLAAARRGAEVTGYEINPVMWLIAWLRLLPFGRRARVRLGTYWGHNLRPYSVIWLYLIDHHMPRMARKIRDEAQDNSYIISYIFDFQGVKPYKKTRNSFVYRGKSFAIPPDQIK